MNAIVDIILTENVNWTPKRSNIKAFLLFKIKYYKQFHW